MDTINKGFLQELAERITVEFAGELERLWMVFPNRRAGLFFTRALAQEITRPIWSPTVLSFEDFVYKFSDHTLSDRMTLMLDLYEVYRKVSPIRESFDNFYFWGEMLLKDFDELDKYLINADDLFISLKNLKEIDARFQFFSDEQKEAMESFWSAALGKPSENKKNFIAFWQSLRPIYHGFNEKLRKHKAGYQGMIYRHVWEKMKSDKITWGEDPVIFAGFNALTVVEENIIRWFIKGKKGRVYWDLDSYYFDDPAHEAGYFLRKYYNDTDFRRFFPKEVPDLFHDSGKEIRVISASQYPGQVHIAGNIIQEIKTAEENPGLEDTVMVLPDESLLPALLYALPDDIGKINITMGYPVTNSSFYNLFEQLIELQEKARRGKSRTWFNHANMINILNHPFVFPMDPDSCRAWVDRIHRNNMIYIPADFFSDLDGLRDLFKVVAEPKDLFDYLMDVLVRIRSHFSPDETAGHLFEKEFALVIYQFFNRLKETFLSRDIDLSFSLIRKIVRSYARNEKIPFTGEPLEGLQIMGLLETRNLDFKNVIMVNVNEGFFPRRSVQSSFIPHNVRRAFLLPTPEHQDAIYSYLFYRLIQRAKNIFLIHNSEDAYNRNAEPSRYIYQLEFESGIPVYHQSLANDISIESRSPVVIYKDDFILKRMARYFSQHPENPKKLTPSKLNHYLSCPITFCYRYVYDVEEKQEVTEDLDAAKFGQILHKVMEKLYQPYQDQMITRERFREIRQGIGKALTDGFSVYHGIDKNQKDFRFEGKNLLGREIVQKYVRKILDIDESQAPFRIHGLEVPCQMEFPIFSQGKQMKVSFRGIIDRVDRKDENMRIIDYKSGRDLSTFQSVNGLFDRSDKNRNKAVFQTFLYALMYMDQHQDTDIPVISGLYNFKELHDDQFDVRIKIKNRNNSSTEPITDIRPMLDEFRTHLTGLIQEIFDPAVPFQHPADLKDCIYCRTLGGPSEFN
jgi:hypothetical protein